MKFDADLVLAAHRERGPIFSFRRTVAPNLPRVSVYPIADVLIRRLFGNLQSHLEAMPEENDLTLQV